MVQRFRETHHTVFTSASALSRGILRSLKGKETLHFNADASNTDLFFRIIHSTNQLSIYGAVSHWSEQFDLNQGEREPHSEEIAEKGESVDKESLNLVNNEILKSMNSQEVKSLVRTPRNPPAWIAGKLGGLRIAIQNRSDCKGLCARFILGPSVTWKISQTHKTQKMVLEASPQHAENTHSPSKPESLE